MRINIYKISRTIIFILVGFNLYAQSNTNQTVSTSNNNASQNIPTITIHAKESSLPSVLSILADESGYNIVTGPNVNATEKITIHLEDAPITEAIDMVVRAAGLSYELVGNSILVAERDRLNSDVGVVPHVIPLKYANALDVRDMMVNITNQITVDVSGNNLLVSVSPKKLSEVKAIIEEIDKPAIQIMLEAKIIEVSLSNEDKKGIDWAKLSSLTTIIAESGDPLELATGGTTASLIPGSTFQSGADGSVVETLVPQTSGTLPTNMYFQRIDGQGSPSFSRQLTAFDITLDFLMKNNRAEVLANSQVVTLNGHEATIKMIDIIPYITSAGGVGGQIQVQREEVGIKLRILPTVNTDGYITAEVTPEISSIYEFIAGVYPRVKKRISTTTVRVLDDQSILIAGLIAATKNKVEHKVPLLHRIPFIGKRLFVHYEELVQKTDLVIQVRPKIVYDNYTGIEKNKYHIETEKNLMNKD